MPLLNNAMRLSADGENIDEQRKRSKRIKGKNGNEPKRIQRLLWNSISYGSGLGGRETRVTGVSFASDQVQSRN